ncbi:ParB/RepB/Spo0J family partition protein [Micromonospora cremea]|uniref:ParB-like nuclease domain-containing protein n=1 Tax=Micromonospora cremea TaxID=709881 RepID=A0A1N6ANC0_9ACTN|nr:ParB N-terminal domain-containing protein [Micromonospora cremea]SIN35519.1 ParB-like nuclease domain-containing protein [Micromonospora cremea]
MKLVNLDPAQLVVSHELSRSGSAKQFEDRLRSSIEEIGLAEPIKVAPLPSGQYLVVDGTMRLRAITAIRDANPDAFKTIAAYVTDYERRFEIRYQTDIYQDLLPSQLAALVEHLHKTERVRKTDIARYIGVSPATLRNYTGLWRLLQRGGLFAKIVELMDVGVIPSSNPYAWLRLTSDGLRCVLKDSFCDGESIDAWVQGRISAARQGNTLRFTTNFVEAATGGLEPRFYRQDEDLRSVKRDLGLRRAGDPQLFDVPVTPAVKSKTERNSRVKRDVKTAVRHLSNVTRESREPVLQTAARSLRKYLQ